MNTIKKYAPAELFIDPAKLFVDYVKKDLDGIFNKGISIGAEEFVVSANPELFVKNAALFYDVKTLPSVY